MGKQSDGQTGALKPHRRKGGVGTKALRHPGIDQWTRCIDPPAGLLGDAANHIPLKKKVHECTMPRGSHRDGEHPN